MFLAKIQLSVAYSVSPGNATHREIHHLPLLLYGIFEEKKEKKERKKKGSVE